MTNNEKYQGNNSIEAPADSYASYKESVRKSLFSIIGEAFEEDTRQTTAELKEERQKAIEALIEENRLIIKEMVEEGKKVIHARAQTAPRYDTFQTDYIDDVLLQIYKLIESHDNGNGSVDSLSVTTATKTTRPVQTELEILPPRDQDEIEAMKIYLNNLPCVISVELLTMVDKSIFRIESDETIDFVSKLKSLPQVLTVEKVMEDDGEKVQVVLNTKSNLSKTQDEMDARVKKIFHGKK